VRVRILRTVAVRIVVAAWMLPLFLGNLAHAEKRVALVVGNAAYQHADKLINPVNDAQGVRDALAKLGFDVTYGEDLDQRALGRTIGQFGDRVEGADVAVVYFAGHGATFGDTPYVVPVDAAFSSLAQVPHELVPVDALIGELHRVKGVRIAILDACRDNNAERQLKRVTAGGGDVTRGLGRTKHSEGLIIAYSTQYMSTAEDAVAAASGLTAGHSPFTAALLNNIATPGLDVTDLFRKVGRQVYAATGGRQRPEISISMYDEYALLPAGPRPASGAAAALPDAQRANAAVPGPAEPAASPQTAVAPPVAPAPSAPLVMALPARPAAPADPCGGGMTVSSSRSPSRCAMPLAAAQERGLKPRDTFRECDNCPEMVVVPAGSFTMGSPEEEGGRFANEGPQHLVRIGRPFAVGRLHVTVDQFAAFVYETHYEARKCWRNPGFDQEGSHPAVCLSWDDARAYAEWMGRKTGKPYRLLSEAEFEYAARGRTSPGAYPRFWFGEEETDLCRYGNGADQNAQDSIAGARGWAIAHCHDGYAYTSPGGHYEPNGFGLYDMFGNAWQWTADCWHDTYKGAPADGSAWTGGACNGGHVVRGGSWYDSLVILRSAKRDRNTSEDNYLGFRLARTLAR
jgi:formylglycine-generating enzyme required for sulfatase activity